MKILKQIANNENKFDYYIEKMTIVQKGLFVDASCMRNPGPMEYKILEAEYIQKNEIIQINPKSVRTLLHSEVFPQATNNIGEFLAIVDAMKYNYEHNYTYTIFSDSQTAIQRVHSKKIKTKLAYNKDTMKILAKLKDAVARLKTHQVPYTIQKRKTEISGEIPADFGRK